MELASLLKVTFGLVLLFSQSLTQEALHQVKTSHRGREGQTVGILSDASFDWVGA